MAEGQAKIGSNDGCVHRCGMTRPDQIDWLKV